MKRSLVQAATRVVTRLQASGFEAYFVGGCVRDLVMDRAPKDIDVATDARPEQVQGLFRRTIPVGAQFGVVLVRSAGWEIEVATFRSDGEYLDGRRPTEVHFCDARSDVQRRDFTINGMLYDPAKEEMLDYVGGRDDIERRVVRCIGDPVRRFEEDKLRVMRAVRFACRLDFAIDPDTFEAAKTAAPGIGVVSAERIREELVLILTEGSPARGIRLLADMGVLAVVLPEVEAMAGVPQPPEFHPEGDVLTHTLLALDALDRPSPGLAMAALLHDVGKPATLQVADRIRFHGHAEVGEDVGRRICERLRFSSAGTSKIAWLVARHMHVADAPRMRLGRLKRLLREEHFSDLLELHRVDCVASHGDLGAWRFCRQKLEELSEEELRPAPLIDGHRLIEMGYEPGPRFKEILQAAETAQLEQRVATPEAAEAFVRSEFPPDAG